MSSATMAARAAGSLTSIVTASSTTTSSSSSPTLLPSKHSFTFSPPKPSLKTLFLKAHNLVLSPPLPLLFPLHLCHSSAPYSDAETAISGDFEENPDVIEQELEGEDTVEFDDDGDDEVGEDDNVKGSFSIDDCKLYVGNLPFSTTSSQLTELFSQAGQVQSVEIIYDKVTDRSRGFGFVTMENIDEAREAIRMFDGSQVGGRTVKVNFPEVPRGAERKVMGPKIKSSSQSFVDTPHKIYAGNLGWSVTTQGLKEAFADQAGFVSARVVYERESGRSRGFGFISFSSAEAAESALSDMNGVELEGRPLRLNVATNRSRSNTEANSEQDEVLSAVNS